MADERVIESYLEGVEALEAIAARMSEGDWQAPSACAGWSATDLAGHILIVAGWWHSWLDRAQQGDSEPPFAWADLDAETGSSLAALPAGTGPDRIAAWRPLAESYAARIPDAWDLPFGAPPATVSVVPLTVGAHAALAAMEWNIHAWDLASARGEDFTPRSGAVLEQGLRVFGVPPQEGDPWHAVLTVSGRTPRR